MCILTPKLQGEGELREGLMKKLVYALLVFVLFISACSTGTPAATPTHVEAPEVARVLFTDQHCCSISNAQIELGVFGARYREGRYKGTPYYQ